MKAPWGCVCGWSVWCVLDTALHMLGIKVRWVCDRHDKVITS